MEVFYALKIYVTIFSNRLIKFPIPVEIKEMDREKLKFCKESYKINKKWKRNCLLSI